MQSKLKVIHVAHTKIAQWLMP